MSKPEASYADVEHARRTTGYLPIENYGLIGNLRTAAMVSMDGSIDMYCCSEFDSPSVFARILDKSKGGHFSVHPIDQTDESFVAKQQYLPNSNILITKFLFDNGVSQIVDFMPRPDPRPMRRKLLLPWIVRRISMIRGSSKFRVEVFPAFNYALDTHRTTLFEDPDSPDGVKKVVFKSETMALDLRVITRLTNTADYVDDCETPMPPTFEYNIEQRDHPGPGVVTEFTLKEGQEVVFIFREPPKLSEVRHVEELSRSGSPSPFFGRRKKQTSINVASEPPTREATRDPNLRGMEEPTSGPSIFHGFGNDTRDQFYVPVIKTTNAKDRPAYSAMPTLDPELNEELVDQLQEATTSFWLQWISRSRYKGRWREAVHRSALTLKLLTYEPTGAVVAAPTFSLPEHIGGQRNWDYRYTWVRDSAFTIYAFIRLGFTEEAKAYMSFMEERMKEAGEKGLQIMYTIHGGRDIPERELNHLEGYRGSRPVRIGNGAAEHLQLDIYGELMDAVYLYNKYGPPISYDLWLKVQKICNFVVQNWNNPDLSIWEVRSLKQNFLYSKVMLWVALSRGLRLADKNSLPCPQRETWLKVRDEIYMEVMEKGWNEKKQIFGQSYENLGSLDSSCLVMPLVFFISPTDPRFISTVNHILKPPEKGGLTVNNLVYRYDTRLSDDGIGEEEGAFSLTTFWLVEALTRAGKYNRHMLGMAERIFEEMLGYANHLFLYSEEINRSGQMLGNFPQAFTHIAMISAAYNLDRVLSSGDFD